MEEDRPALAQPGSDIARIDGYLLACQLPDRRGNARVSFDQRRALAIAITTSAGVTGWGESWAYPEAAAGLVRAGMGAALIGRDVTLPGASIGPLFEALGPDRRGINHMALSALDMAIWDAFGRSTGRPIHALLGGARRLKLPAYASGPLLPEGPDRYAGLDAALADYVARGFRAIKLRIGISLDEDLSALRKARAALGPSGLLMADLNESGNGKSALALATAAADLGLAWLEEPLAHDNLPAYQRLAARLPVPLAGGESLYGVAGFRDILAMGGLDIVQPDLALCGGFSEGRKIAALAEAHGVPLIPHVWGTGINYLASLQFTASLPPIRNGRVHYPLHEVDTGHNPLRDCIVPIALDEDGCVTVPEAPGLGVAISPEQFALYVVDRWTIA
jgi:D-galactarolactone cycloisomerase